MESLDPSLPQITPVYKSLTEGLKKAGYKERVDLFGAPYDFRLAADGLEQVQSSFPQCSSPVTATFTVILAQSNIRTRPASAWNGFISAGRLLPKFDSAGGARCG